MIKAVLLRVLLVLGMVGMFVLGQEAGYSAHKLEMLRKMAYCSSVAGVPAEAAGLPEEIISMLYDLAVFQCYEEELLKKPIIEGNK